MAFWSWTKAPILSVSELRVLAHAIVCQWRCRENKHRSLGLNYLEKLWASEIAISFLLVTFIWRDREISSSLRAAYLNILRTFVSLPISKNLSENLKQFSKIDFNSIQIYIGK